MFGPMKQFWRGAKLVKDATKKKKNLFSDGIKKKNF
jgi:hypothetical protein